MPEFDTSHPYKGKYDQEVLNEAQPEWTANHKLNHPELTADMKGDEAKKLLWDFFESE